jgi:hypothetical protein
MSAQMPPDAFQGGQEKTETITGNKVLGRAWALALRGSLPLFRDPIAA